MPWPTVLTAVGVTAVVVLLALGANGPYRADHDYWAAAATFNQGVTLSGTAAAPTNVGPAYFAHMQSAMSLNPWEPTYPAAEATVLASAAARAPNLPDATTDLQRARALLAQAVAESPLLAPYAANEAQVDLELASIPSSSTRTELSAAVSLARKAVEDDPRDSSYHQLLSEAVAAKRKAAPKS